MGGDEIKFVQEAFDTNWISPVGPHLIQFEKELTEYSEVPHCAALSSGTAAIHLALLILGVKTGDEVICSSFTFSGSCNPVIYTGATPVFVDSESSTWNMDPELLQQAIEDRIKKNGAKPKAIIAVHLYGMPAHIELIKSIADRYEIPLIEDAAEAMGSTYNGIKLGSFGSLGIYSFNGNKIITTSGGGALISAHESWIQQARFLATQARDPAPYYQHSQIGYNYRLSNVCAGIGRGQLRVLDSRVRQRRVVHDFYLNTLGQLAEIEFLKEPEGMFSNRWLTTVLFDIRKVSPEALRQELEKKNIETRPLWKPMHLQPVFKNCPAYVNGVSQDLFNRGLCLPSGSNLTSDQLNFVAESLREIIQKKSG
jgi:dTDP-4-amino-4,6-dideoxygalactose transaminase